MQLTHSDQLISGNAYKFIDESDEFIVEFDKINVRGEIIIVRILSSDRPTSNGFSPYTTCINGSSVGDSNFNDDVNFEVHDLGPREKNPDLFI